MFGRVLVANRGEIAVRVIRTLRRLGIEPVLAAALPDRAGLAARMAGHVVLLPGSGAAASYLDVDAVVAAARRAACDAIHPGYGFLSESPLLADACHRADIAFIGPSAATLRLLGDKTAARALAQQHEIPVVPGIESVEPGAAGENVLRSLGLPVMLKARAGGGGRGMRRIAEGDDIAAAIESAAREAAAAFGDGSLFAEKLVLDAHHVEVQVVADRHGTVLHLGERDCSVQRRHQKLVEETPSPVVSPALRERLTGYAVTLARASNLVAAATVEFLVRPGPEPACYFLEVNPRLQVEHPVTEAVTGLDLVELQLRAAAGEPLGMTQDHVTFIGAAIELRLNAEAPWDGFRPSSGRLAAVNLPDGIRVDAGFETGDLVPPQFDSLLAKLIAHSPDRASAVDDALGALEALRLHGVETNAALLTAILESPTFRTGEATTAWLDEHLDALIDLSQPGDLVVAAAAAALLASPSADPFAGPRWLGAGAAACWLSDGQRVLRAAISHRGRGQVAVTIDGSQYDLAVSRAAGESFTVTGRERTVTVTPSGAPGEVFVRLDSRRFRFTVVPPPPAAMGVAAATGIAGSTVQAPLAGTVIEVAVSPGDAVAHGDLLLLLEAMKMEHRVTAAGDGVVATVHVEAGAVVSHGDPLLELVPAAAD